MSKQAQSVLDLRLPRRPPQRNRRRLALVIAGTTITVTAVAISLYLWRNGRPQVDAQSAMRTAVASVGKLMFLPTGEEPTYGTVSDKSKLSDQTFFAKAENGDEILIYQKARLTILYRPSVNKIVNVGPVILGNDGSPYVSSRFLIKNGTPDQSKTDATAKKIKEAYPNAQIVAQVKASRDYPKSLVIDLSKSNQPLAEQIADSLGIEAGQVPLGEPIEPAADFLIIIGSE